MMVSTLYPFEDQYPSAQAEEASGIGPEEHGEDVEIEELNRLFHGEGEGYAEIVEDSLQYLPAQASDEYAEYKA